VFVPAAAHPSAYAVPDGKYVGLNRRKTRAPDGRYGRVRRADYHGRIYGYDRWVMMVVGKEFLGRGWRFPVKPGTDGKLEFVEYEEDIAESIRILLDTSPGERVMRPDFGCGASGFVFEVMDTATITAIENSVRETLEIYEPRIIVNGVKTDVSRIDDGELLIEIAYTVRSTNARTNIVYPFYLTEGRL
jgi:phage baseplate assembly protein W